MAARTTAALFSGQTSPLATLRRDLAVMTRLTGAALELLARHDVALSVAEVASGLGVEPEAARMVLQVLEHGGLTDSTHYRVTAAGKAAAST